MLRPSPSPTEEGPSLHNFITKKSISLYHSKRIRLIFLTIVVAASVSVTFLKLGEATDFLVTGGAISAVASVS
jgi:hypothetical protein